MKRAELIFDRPAELEAVSPPEERGRGRDDVRLLVSAPSGHVHAQFRDLPRFLSPGDLLVVNESASLPASLPACGSMGPFTINLSTQYGPDLWLTEPRWSPAKPGPLPLSPGDRIEIGGFAAHLIVPYPDLPDLWFVQTQGDLSEAMAQQGSPIRYGYVQKAYPLQAYQTLFGVRPGSAEMPSAGRPFTHLLVAVLREQGVNIARITLHAGVSSQELEAEEVEAATLFPEPFRVPKATADAVNLTRQQGHRVIAVGTTVVRALESAWADDSEQIQPIRGFTRLFVHPGRDLRVVTGLLTGFHDPVTSHLAMLYTLGGRDLIRTAYAEAIREGYLWHEFGDSHLILTG